MPINRYLSVLLFLLFVNFAFSQNEIVPVLKSGEWGIMDTSLNLLVPYQYQYVEIVNQSFYIAKSDSNFALFSKNGNIILPFDYQFIRSESLNCLIVRQNNKYGIFDFSGNKLVECGYDSIEMTDSKIAFLIKGKNCRYYNFENHQISEFYNQIYSLGDNYFFMEKDGLKSIYYQPLDFISQAFIQIERKRNNLFFCTDSMNQKFVIYKNEKFQLFRTDEFYYQEINSLVFAFRINNKIDIVIKNLNKVVEIEADAILNTLSSSNNMMSGFITGKYYIFSKNHKKGLLDEEFNVIIKPEYDGIQFFNTDFLVVKNGKQGLYSNDGKMLLSPDYDQFSKSGNYWIVRNNSKYAVLDEKQHELIKPEYDDISMVYGDRFIVTLNRKKGLIDKNNRIVIAINYQSIDCNDNAIVLKKDDKYALATLNGDFILPLKYEEISELSAQYYKFSEQGKYGIISVSGVIIANPMYRDVTPTENNSIFYVTASGLLPSSLKDLKEKFDLDISIPEIDDISKWYQTGIINSSGQILLEPKYYLIQITADYEAGMFYIKDKSSVTVIAYEANGKLIDKTEYKNYLTVKKANIQSGKNIWKSGGNEQLYGLFTFDGRELLKYQFRNISINFLKNPNLVLTTGQEGGYGVVNETSAKILLPAMYQLIHLQDFKYSKLARCVRKSGATVLIDSLVNIVEKGIGYMDDFRNNYTRVNKGGKIVISEKRAYMLPKVIKDSSEYQYINFDRYQSNICQGGKWGVMDNQGIWHILPKYQFLQQYFKNVFIAYNGLKWGVISPDDQILIDFKYDEIRFFDNHESKKWANIPFYKVRINNKWGVIDSLGNAIVQCEYDAIDYFKHNNTIHFKTLVDYNKILFGLIDKKAKELLAPQYLFIGPFINGIARISTKNKCWQFIDKQFIKLPTECFVAARDFKDGMAAVKTAKGWGFIDEAGKLIIQPQYLEVGDFYEGLATVKFRKPPMLFGMIRSKQIYSLTNKNGEIVYNIKSKYCSNVSNGQIVIKKGKRFHVLNLSNKKTLSQKYNQVLDNQDYGLYVVQNSNRQYSVIKRNGETLVPYGKYSKYSKFSEGLCYVEGEKKGYIDTSGALKLTIDFQKAGDFNCGLASVKVKNKFGYINQQGEIAIEPRYSEAEDFNFNVAMVRDENYSRFHIDKKGNRLPDFQGIDSLGYQIVEINGLKGIVDYKGKKVTNPVANQISLFREELAAFGIQKLYGLYDDKGKQVAENKFMNITQIKEGLIKMENLQEIKYLK